MSKIGYRIKSTSNKAANIYVNMRPMNFKVLEMRTGLTVLPSEWSQAKQRAKGRDISCMILNTALSDLSAHIDSSYNNVQISGGVISLEWFKKCVDAFFNRVNEADVQILDNFYSVFLDRMKTDSAKSVGYKENTIKSYETFKAQLEEYQEAIGTNIKFSDLDKDLFEDFFSWLLHRKKYKASYVNRTMTRLKTVCKEAASYGINVNPYYSLYKPKTIRAERHLHIITQDDIEKIKRFNPTQEYLINTKKWTLIGLYIGQRISDLLKLKPEDIRQEDNGVLLINVSQQKTGKNITAGVKDPCVVDILLNHFPRKIGNQSYNRFIKDLCEAAGIDDEVKGYKVLEGRKQLITGKKHEFITSHDLRRSFATNNFYRNIPVSIIMGITGHSKESTFFEYIGHKFTKDQHAKAFLDYL
jgi:integrase